MFLAASDETKPVEGWSSISKNTTITEWRLWKMARGISLQDRKKVEVTSRDPLQLIRVTCCSLISRFAFKNYEKLRLWLIFVLRGLKNRGKFSCDCKKIYNYFEGKLCGNATASCFNWSFLHKFSAFCNVSLHDFDLHRKRIPSSNTLFGYVLRLVKKTTAMSQDSRTSFGSVST